MMSLSTAARRSAALSAALLAAGLAMVLGAADPAAAHGGDAEMTVTLTRTGEDVEAIVTLIYVDDGHGVPDATVTVVVDDGTPTTMTAGAEEGEYLATVTADPGTTLRFTSVDPPASVTETAPAAEEPADPGSTTAPTPDTTAAPTTAAEPEESAAPSTVPGATSGLVTDEGDGEDNTVVVLGAITAGLGLLAVLSVVMLQRSRKASEAGATDGADEV